LYELRVINPRNRKRFESIGVDRIDNDGSYRLSNLVPCCGPCNSIRSSILSHEEMLRIGASMREIWEERLKRPSQ
jgi:hypothetical protein